MKISFSFLPKDRNAWMMLAGVVGVCLLGAGIVLGPIQKTFEELDSRIAAQEKKLARNLGILAPQTKGVVEKDYGRYGSVIKMRGSSEEENAQMLSEIDKLAGQNKLSLASTKPREIRKDRDCEFYSVEVEVEAGMTQLLGFIYALETSPQLLRLDRLALDSKGNKESDIVRGTLVISKVVTL